ncbi:metal-dependent hydrolase [Histidinibacterium lentulum]|uniref:Metal-dependent hydrolase n=1 Tax=Histidinibacterium lentulum TaxID=2480588 RepID=A0A3N2R7N4_9RHOB|nr:metal-dependent hydrolase [Histidinibacterium lentulum]ROU03455.1 metal-dependent hydrolase [Histidinibacterium lentulum]
MKIVWLGHSAFRIEIGGEVLLIDPWLEGNPAFPSDRRAEAISGATHILLTHAHGDHASEVPSVAADTSAPVCCVHELAELWLKPAGVEARAFGKGGTLALDGCTVTMVTAAHSSSLDFLENPPPAGGEAGFVIRGEGRSVYVSGDTDVMADMAQIAARHAPDVGILCCGGHYTMDMEGAAFAAKTYFDFRTVIPCHYGTFPILAQSADPLVQALPGVDVRTPAVMEAVTL